MNVNWIDVRAMSMQDEYRDIEYELRLAAASSSCPWLPSDIDRLCQMMRGPLLQEIRYGHHML